MLLKGFRISQKEKGVSIIFLVLIFPVLLGILSLIIDLSISLTVRESSTQELRLIALAAIRGYYQLEGSHDAKETAALIAAKNVAGANLAFSMRQPYMAELTTADEDEKVLVELGQFFPKDDKIDSDSCGNGIELPCFKKYEAGDNINAARVSGIRYNSGTNFFAKAIGQSQTPKFLSSAVAVVRPREACFIVDLSTSATRETHITNTKNLSGEVVGWPAEFAFSLSQNNIGDQQFMANPVHESRWIDIVAKGSRLNASSNQQLSKTAHFADDYNNFSQDSGTILNDWNSYPKNSFHPSDYDASALSGVYTIDTFTKPEPLSSILDGVKQSVTQLKNRSNVGDKVCIIGVDNTLAWPRIVNLSLISGSSNDAYNHLQQILDLENNFSLSMSHGFFPNASGRTNLLIALREALNQFKRNGSSYASQLVVLITDGAQTCGSCPVQADQFPAPLGNSIIDSNDIAAVNSCNNINDCPWADINADDKIDDIDKSTITKCSNRIVGCANLYGYYNEGMFGPGGIKEMVEKYMAPNNIPLHTILISEQVAPHTVDIEEDNKCLPENTIRERGLSPVKGHDGSIPISTAWENSIVIDNGTPFFQIPYDWYQLSLVSGGVYGPVRSTSFDNIPVGCGDDSCSGDCCPGIRRCKEHNNRVISEQILGYLDEVMSTDNTYSLVSVTNSVP
jgi:hypothetical protein